MTGFIYTQLFHLVEIRNLLSIYLAVILGIYWPKRFAKLTITNYSISAKSIVTCTLKWSTCVAACCITVTWWNWWNTLIYIYKSNYKIFCNMQITFEVPARTIFHDSSSCTYTSSTQYFQNVLIPVQVVPFPENPLLHVHWKDPSVLLQVASLEHGDEAHSFMSIIVIENKYFFKSQFCIRYYPGQYYVLVHIIH